MPMQPGDHRGRLAKFVGELWAQRRHVVETRRRIDKRFEDENDWFVRKDTELVDCTPVRHGRVKAIRAMTSTETFPLLRWWA